MKKNIKIKINIVNDMNNNEHDIENDISNKLDIIKEYQNKINTLQKHIRENEKKLEKMRKKQIDFKLNKAQQNAVENIDSNNIIIACPGSGKTHTLIAKVVKLVEIHKINPDTIILITFTKKAAQEMNERLEKYLGNRKLHHTGTIHGLAYRVLQKHDKINYTILDEYDAHKNIKDSISKYVNGLKDEEKSLLCKSIINIYEKLASEYPTNIDNLLIRMKLQYYKKYIIKGLNEYSNFKEKHKYLDFNDLMHKFLKFLKEDRSEEFKSNIKYILFDEYQDINSMQDTILKYMNEKCQNLTVVGDDAQSIYAFRGSDSQYILTFSKQYSSVNTFYLEKNYRSTEEIVDLCNNIIVNNNSQFEKNMEAVHSQGIKPKIVGFKTTDDEIEFIVNSIEYNKSKLGTNYKDQVIMARKNRQLDCFELRLIKKNIPYVKTKGIGLLDRVHIKDFLAFLVILVNDKSIVHWKRILKLLDGVGDVTANKILQRKDIKNHIKKHFDRKILPLTKLLNKIEKKKLKFKIKYIILFLEPYIKKHIKLKDKYSAEEKISDLKTLQLHIHKSGSLVKFLEDIHLNVNMDEKIKENETNDYLLLSTIHGAKGLEWDTVFLAGISSDLLPSYRPYVYTEELDNMEEERRLFYVGCSRAKKSLLITLSYDYHFVPGSVYASPFIKELPDFLYDGFNLEFPKKLTKGNVTNIISNYLTLNSSSHVYEYLKTLKYTYKSFYMNSTVGNMFYKNGCEKIYGSFIDNLLTKMVFQKYSDSIECLDVPTYQKFNIRKDYNYYKYIDEKSDWRDNLQAIFNVSLKRTYCRVKKNIVFEWIKKEKGLYEKMEKAMLSIVDQCLKVKKKAKLPKNMINLHMNVSYGNVFGETDMVVGRTLIEIKTSTVCIATTRNVLQTIMYRYMLRMKDIRIDNIILYNPLLGEMYDLQITPKWKDTFRIYSEILSR
jgi:DNA helicase II / ATP-dependent DNA helicase PcrA